VEHTDSFGTELQVKGLQEIARNSGDLPALPGTAVMAMQLADKPEVSARELQFVIAKDQALTARILKIVNSAMYSFDREVSTLTHAIAILGLDTVRSIIVAAAIQQVFPSGSAAGKDLTSKLFWEHSWGTALAAKAIAVNTNYPVPEEAFTCGLLHDMGKMVILKNRGELYRDILSDVYRGATTFCEAESRAFGFSHAQVGALLSQKWRFPPQLTEAILYHHDCLAAPKHRKLAAIVALANGMMTVLEVGFQKDKSLKLEEEASAKCLTLSAQVLPRIVTDVQTMIHKLPAMTRS